MPEDIPLFDIRHAATAQEMQLLGTLFQEYAADLSIDLGFQDFEQEIATLPGEYAPPRGAVLLAWVDGCPAGCCALRPLDA